MIVCCGDALIDMIEQQSAEHGRCYVPVPGGALLNTAVALSKLRQPVGFLGGLSTDRFGQQLSTFLRDAGVDADFCKPTVRPTTLAFVHFDAGVPHYHFLDHNSAGRMVQDSDLPILPDAVEGLHFGAISLCTEPSGSSYEAFALREARARVISLDPNIRSSFISDADRHRDRIARLIAISDIVKISDEDLDWLHPNHDMEELTQSWLAAGTAVVILTQGEKGAIAFTNRHRCYRPAEAVQVVDTVGAGDIFMAGFLAGLRNSAHYTKERLPKISADDLEKALTYAQKAAAYSVSHTGATAPSAEDLAIDS